LTASIDSGNGANALSSQSAAKMGNFITGEGLPNPAPKVIRNWGELPAGRKWGTSAGVDIDPKDGHVWAYERCGAGAAGGAGGGGVTCETNDVDPVFKFDRNSGKVLANFGKGVMVTPHGIHVDPQGNVWIADFAGNKEGTKGHQVHKFSPKGEKLLSLGIAGKPGNADGQFNQPNDAVVGPDGSIYVSDGHDGQGMTTNAALAEGLKRGATARISKFSPDGKFIKSWGTLGVRHGEFRTPHALVFDAKGRLWVADRGNHRIEIFDADGKYLESRYSYGRISGIFIRGNTVYAHWSPRRGSHHRVHSAVRARRPGVPGDGRRRRRGRRGGECLRRGRAELVEPGGRRVHQIRREVNMSDTGTVGTRNTVASFPSVTVAPGRTPGRRALRHAYHDLEYAARAEPFVLRATTPSVYEPGRHTRRRRRR
jgi:DNA-binding beta-propeller fold protein YncE